MSLNTSPLSTCPEHLQLLALAEGTLSESEATIIANHIAECRDCDVRLDAIEEQSDDLVRALAMLPASQDDEETFQSLQAKLLASPVPFGDSQEVTPDSLEHAVRHSNVPANLVLPIELGNYELLEQIGAGANGAVFRARHRRLEKQVAVKLLINVAGPAVEEFLNEMRVIGKLDHPNVIQATDAGEHDGIYFLVMEFVPGLDVSSLLRQHGPLAMADACEVVRQTALGLSVAHQHDLVHRDVKTSNLLFTSSGQIKLLDLGLATISSLKPEVPTEQSGPRGTADYMAPEQWREANAVTAKADIYSLGCTLFKLLTGAPPFRPLPDAVSSLEEAHLNGEVPNVRVRNLPGGLDMLIRRMLAKDPADRPASAREVAQQLAKYTVGADLPKLARKTMPDAAPTHGATTVDASTAMAPVGFSTRRVALFATLGVLGTIAWKMNHAEKEASSINTGQWRSLAPANPPLIPLTFGTGDVTPLKDYSSLDVADNTIEIASTKPVLLQFGRPLTGAFRFRATLQRDDWTAATCGVVFRLRAERPREFQFQAFELQQSDSQWWLYWNSYPQNVEEEPIALAGATLPAQDASEIELEVGLGVSGFPDFFVDGKRVPKSDWTFSKEARTFTASHARQIATTYAGRVGVLHYQGKTLVRSPKLMYIK